MNLQQVERELTARGFRRQSTMNKSHIFRRDGQWATFVPPLNWDTPGRVVVGTFAEVARTAASWWRFAEAERLARP